MSRSRAEEIAIKASKEKIKLANIFFKLFGNCHKNQLPFEISFALIAQELMNLGIHPGTNTYAFFANPRNIIDPENVIIFNNIVDTQKFIKPQRLVQVVVDFMQQAIKKIQKLQKQGSSFNINALPQNSEEKMQFFRKHYAIEYEYDDNRNIWIMHGGRTALLSSRLCSKEFSKYFKPESFVQVGDNLQISDNIMQNIIITYSQMRNAENLVSINQIFENIWYSLHMQEELNQKRYNQLCAAQLKTYAAHPSEMKKIKAILLSPYAFELFQLNASQPLIADAIREYTRQQELQAIARAAEAEAELLKEFLAKPKVQDKSTKPKLSKSQKKKARLRRKKAREEAATSTKARILIEEDCKITTNKQAEEEIVLLEPYKIAKLTDQETDRENLQTLIINNTSLSIAEAKEDIQTLKEWEERVRRLLDHPIMQQSFLKILSGDAKLFLKGSYLYQSFIGGKTPKDIDFEVHLQNMHEIFDSKKYQESLLMLSEILALPITSCKSYRNPITGRIMTIQIKIDIEKIDKPVEFTIYDPKFIEHSQDWVWHFDARRISLTKEQNGILKYQLMESPGFRDFCDAHQIKDSHNFVCYNATDSKLFQRTAYYMARENITELSPKNRKKITKLFHDQIHQMTYGDDMAQRLSPIHIHNILFNYHRNDTPEEKLEFLLGCKNLVSGLTVPAAIIVSQGIDMSLNILQRSSLLAERKTIAMR